MIFEQFVVALLLLNPVFVKTYIALNLRDLWVWEKQLNSTMN